MENKKIKIKATFEAGAIRNLIKVIEKINFGWESVTLNFNESGLIIAKSDPSINTAALFEIDKATFEDYEISGAGEIIIMLKMLADSLDIFRNKVTFEYDGEILIMKEMEFNKKITLRTIEPDKDEKGAAEIKSIFNEFDSPENKTFTTKTDFIKKDSIEESFKEILKINKGALSVIITAKKEGLIIKSNEENGISNYERFILGETDNKKSETSEYRIGDLINIMSFDNGEKISLWFGQDVPLFIKMNGEKAKAAFLLAPFLKGD